VFVTSEKLLIQAWQLQGKVSPTAEWTLKAAQEEWSAFHLHRTPAWEVVQAQCERSARQLARNRLQLGKGA
jgi:hypothetical protein